MNEGGVNVIDFVETAGRKDEIASRYTRYVGTDGWHFLTAGKTIRRCATGSIWLSMAASLPAGGIVYFDGAMAIVEEQK